MSVAEVRLVVTLQYATWNAERRALAFLLERMLGGAQIISAETHAFIRVPGEKHGQGVWGIFERALSKAYLVPEVTHILTLREDVIPCRDFLIAVKHAITAVPDEVLTFCSNRPVVAEARRLGHSWVLSPDGSWGGTTVLPVPLVGDFLRWNRKYVRPTYQAEDGRIDLFCLATGRFIWTSCPSLLYHNHAATSMKGHKWEWRREPIWFIGMDRSPLRIDWTPPSEPIYGSGRYGAIIKAAVPDDMVEDAGLKQLTHLRGRKLWRHEGKHGDFAAREAHVG